MLKSHWIFLPLFMIASTGFTQTLLEQAAAEGRVVMSTDPEVAAEVERKAAEIIATQEREGQPQSSGAADAAPSGATSGPLPAKSRAGKAGKKYPDRKKRRMPADMPSVQR